MPDHVNTPFWLDTFNQSSLFGYKDDKIKKDCQLIRLTRKFLKALHISLLFSFGKKCQKT